MKIFISWSGEQSKHVAVLLKDWLPKVLQQAKPWLSNKDIDAGTRWPEEIETNLVDSNYGIICLTRQNINKPWIYYEAGALANKLSKPHVCPYLIDLTPSEIPSGPLTIFQAKEAIEKDTYDLVCGLNKECREPVEEQRIKYHFGREWPSFREELKNLPKENTGTPSKRPTEDIIDEILVTVRRISQNINEHRISHLGDPSQSKPLFQDIKNPILDAWGKKVLERPEMLDKIKKFLENWNGESNPQ
jgi:hypothetical protein